MCCVPWPHNMGPIACVCTGTSVGDWPPNEIMVSAQLFFFLNLQIISKGIFSLPVVLGPT